MSNSGIYQGHLPFAVVGSSDEVKIGNKMVKARQYPWGTVQGTVGSPTFYRTNVVYMCCQVRVVRENKVLKFKERLSNICSVV